MQRLFDLFLARDVPDEGEASFAFVGSRPYRSNADLGTSEALLDRVRSLGETTAVTRGDIEGTRYIAVPITDDGARRGVFVVTADLAHERAEVSEAVQVSAGIALAMLALVSGLAFVAVGRVLAPLRALGATARSIGSTDDLTRRIDVRTDDEIGELGHLFNAMLDRLEQAFALQREFVSDAGHELRTPITIIRGHLELLGEHPETFKVVSDELDRMSRFVEDLLTLAKAERPDFLHLDTLDLDLLTDELMAKATKLAPRDWRLEHTGAGLLTADRQRLTQAVMNLAHNAVQHTVRGRHDRARLGARRRRRADLGRRQRPGRRARGPRADLRAPRPLGPQGRRRARPGDRADDRAAPTGADRARERAGRGRALHDRHPGGARMSRILIAEDEANLVSFLEKGLRAAGHVTTAVGDGPSAVALARDEDFELLILDLGLPGLDGTEVLRALRGMGRRLPVIILSARDDVARQGRGPAARRGRLRDQAVRVRRAARARAGAAARHRDERAG